GCAAPTPGPESRSDGESRPPPSRPCCDSDLRAPTGAWCETRTPRPALRDPARPDDLTIRGNDPPFSTPSPFQASTRKTCDSRTRSPVDGLSSHPTAPRAEGQPIEPWRQVSCWPPQRPLP